MAGPNYRVTVRHVRYWRGKPHRWSTVYPFVGTLTSALTDTDADHVAQKDNALCYGSAPVNGGIYGCDIYDVAAKGHPIISRVYFDWESPSAWTGYAATGWTETGGYILNAFEPALVVEWPAGLSKGGKPVTLKKWYHAVPADQVTPGAGDVSAASQTSLQQAAVALQSVLASKGLVLGAQASSPAGTPRVLAYYGAHQAPRGRRRKTSKQLQSQISGLQAQLNAELAAEQGGIQASP